jgi:YfiH family protein
VTVDIIEASWPAPSHIVAGTTLRSGGVSLDTWSSLNLAAHVDDDPAAVEENRSRFALDCNLPGEPVWLNQVHSNRAALERPPDANDGCDALVTRTAGKVCAVLTADCLPVLFCAKDGSEIAAAHAGWRGLCDGVLEATLNVMQTAPGSIIAWLGPAISQEAFEVGPEVRRQFLDKDAQADGCFQMNARGRYQADLYAIARHRLASAGVSSVTGGEYCTFADPDRFFSYRRDGQCGRMASFVYRQD